MRFSISLSHHDLARAIARDEAADPPVFRATAAARDRLVDLARGADGAGADTIWVNEDPDGWDAVAILTLLATTTTKVQLATGVTSPLLRHPNQIAAAISTLDLISGGRAALGIGRGEPDWYRDGLGIAVPKQPLDALSQAIELIRTWWRPPHRAGLDAPLSTSPTDNASPGPFPVRDWERTVNPWPAGQHAPPIIIAAAGPLALTLAGQVADGVMFNDLASDAWLAEAIARVRGAATAAGRDPAGLRFTYNSAVLITDDPEPELRRRRTMLALIHGLPGMDRQLRDAGHDIDPIIAAVRRNLRSDDPRVRGGGFPAIRRYGDLRAAAEAVPLELVERLAVVGSHDHVAARLRTLADLGIDEIMVRLPAADEPADLLADRITELRELEAGRSTSSSADRELL